MKPLQLILSNNSVVTRQGFEEMQDFSVNGIEITCTDEILPYDPVMYTENGRVYIEGKSHPSGKGLDMLVHYPIGAETSIQFEIMPNDTQNKEIIVGWCKRCGIAVKVM